MFNIIVDSREQQPWNLTSSSISNIISRKLDTGDYSIEGMENILCIERKKTVAELASNVTEKRFTHELERMVSYPYKFLLLEFDFYQIDRFPEGSEIPRRLWPGIRIKGPFIMKVLSEAQIKYGVHVVPCSNTQYAEYIAINIMKRVYELNNGK